MILAFGLTGYLLPWDQRAYWATVVTINISRLTPVAGEWSRRLLQGGADIGALTLTRWYAVHVIVLPAVAVRARRRAPVPDAAARHLRAVAPRAGASRIRSFPYQAARDLTVAVVVGVLLAVLAWRGAPALEAPADPTASDYIPRPEWYFLGLFQLLKYFPGKLEVVGAIVIPGSPVRCSRCCRGSIAAASRDPRTRRLVARAVHGRSRGRGDADRRLARWTAAAPARSGTSRNRRARS